MTQQPQDPEYSQQQPQQPAYGGHSTPAPLTADQERSWAALAHAIPAIATVLSAGTLGFIGSLVIYLIYRDRGPFVRASAANSLNVQILTLIVLIISVPLMFVVIGFVTYFAALVFAFVVHVIAAVKANNGEWYQPPLTPRFVK